MRPRIADVPAERLQKILAAAGVASRRASEALIAAGRVTVDGRTARLGDQADPAAARIEVDGRPLEGAVPPTYLALHKPLGVTSTVRDPHATTTVLQLLPTALLDNRQRLYPVGRLDRDSEGLLLLSNDGAWAQHVLHPSYGVEREYAVGLTAWLTAGQRAELDRGVDLTEGRAAFVRRIRPAAAAETAELLAALAPATPGLVWYRVVLKHGWKRQVRRMFAVVGVPIARLVRVRIGPVRLDGLASGRYRRLRGPEVRALGSGPGARMAAGNVVRREHVRPGARRSHRQRLPGPPASAARRARPRRDGGAGP